MSGVTNDETCIVHLAAHLSEMPHHREHEDMPNREDFEDDASLFMTVSINSLSGQGICGNLTLGPGAEDGKFYENLDSQNAQIF